MNTSFLVSRGAQKAAHWMRGYILDQCEWTWTPSVTCQLFSCWGQALLSEKRSLSRLHPASVPKTSDTSSPAAPAASSPPDWENQLTRCLLPSPEKEGSQMLGTVGARGQAVVVARAQWTGAHCHTECQVCFRAEWRMHGLMSAWDTCGCKGCRGDAADDVLCKTLGYLLCARQL